MQCRPFSLTDAREVCSWRYPAPYDIYNFSDWDDVCRQNWAISDEKKRDAQFCTVEENSALIGFLRFLPTENGPRLGLGLAPSHCGRGQGGSLMALALAEARRRFGHGLLTLEVRRFNSRAIACYRRAGWETVGEAHKDTPLGAALFEIMTHPF